MTEESERQPEREQSSPGYRIIDAVPFLASAGAGIYLLQTQSASGGSSWFQVIAHGMGIYFIAKAVYMGRTLALQKQIRDAVSSQAYGD